MISKYQGLLNEYMNLLNTEEMEGHTKPHRLREKLRENNNGIQLNYASRRSVASQTCGILEVDIKRCVRALYNGCAIKS